MGLTSLPEHPSSSAGTRGISKQNLVLPPEIEEQDLRSFFPRVALTLSSEQSHSTFPHPAESSSTDLWLLCSGRVFPMDETANVLLQHVDVEHSVTDPLGNALSIASVPPAGRAHTSAWQSA